MSKNALINEYIARAEAIIAENNQTKAKNFVIETITVFKNEITNIDKRLDYTNFYRDDHQSNYVNDVQMIKAHLINYRVNLKSGFVPFKNDDHSVNVQTTVNTTIENNIVVQTEIAIENINKLTEDILSVDEKNELEEKIAALQLEVSKKKKDKNRISEKLMNVLKFVVTKGPQAFMAVSSFLDFVSKEIMPLFE